MSRLVLARMKTLEEGFTSVVQELRQLRRSGGGYPQHAGGTPESGDANWKRARAGRSTLGEEIVAIEVAGRARDRGQGATTAADSTGPSGGSATMTLSKKGKGKEVAVPSAEAD